MNSSRKFQLAIFILDIILVLAPILLIKYSEINPIAYLPSIIVLVLIVNLWGGRKILLEELEKKIPFARMRQVAKRGDAELYQFVDELTVDLVSKLDKLRKGELYLSGSDEYYRFVTKSIKNAEESVLALDVNVNLDMLWNWESRLLSEYYSNNVMAVKGPRKVNVQRVFVFKSSDALLPDGQLRQDILRILSRQVDDGIEVKVAFWEDLHDTHPKITLSRDYLVIDNCKAIHAPIPQVIPEYEEAIVTKAPVEVNKYKELHEQIWERSRNIN